MRIKNLRLRDSKSRDIEVPLQRMADSDDALEALRGRKLLDLVRHLAALGPAPEVGGWLQFKELWLLHSDVADKVLVKVWVDWFDYAALTDGLPKAHYRFQIKQGEQVVNRDARAYSVEEAERVIFEGFGWPR